jgi:hypothetical protein
MRNPRIAILGEDRPGFVKPMAEGLRRLVAAAGAETDLFPDGLKQLRRLRPYWPYHNVRGLARYVLKDWPQWARFLARYRPYDALVIVNSLPEVFLRSFFDDARVRALLPDTPLILYDAFYLPTRGHWWRWLRDGYPEAGIPQGGQWGMERYDWYLCASAGSEMPMPDGPQPYSLVGLDLNDGTLYPEQHGEFVALIDFAQPYHERERALQIAACEETGTPYIALEGRYSQAEIRKIYRRCSVYFVGFRESFGVPICELQACGSYVFLAHAHWAPSHWVKRDLSDEGPGQLSPNFIVYDNNKKQLVAALRRVRAHYAPEQVVRTFRQWHPQLFHGDLAAMHGWLARLRSGEIHSRSHEAYARMAATDYRGVYSRQMDLIRDDGEPRVPINVAPPLQSHGRALQARWRHS